MNNEAVRNKLLDIFEDLAETIEEGTYLKAMNLLGKMEIETRPVVNVPHHLFLEMLDRIDGIGAPLGDRVIGENFLVTRPNLIFPILTQEECDFLLHKFETDGRWSYLIDNEETYIFNKDTMRFALRKSTKGKQIEKRCKLEQFPELYTVNPRTGRSAIRRVG
ncbi:hypothetical protein BASA81_008128 [Batrachochytrium salamandrivorans]|nr:hypothetical protein BASA81_008128 [Batrachochytrium salamandrivorans]